MTEVLKKLESNPISSFQDNQMHLGILRKRKILSDFIVFVVAYVEVSVEL